MQCLVVSWSYVYFGCRALLCSLVYITVPTASVGATGHTQYFGVIQSSALFQYWKDVMIIPIWNWNPIGIQFQIGDAVDLGTFFYETNDHIQFGIGIQLESNSKLEWSKRHSNWKWALYELLRILRYDMPCTVLDLILVAQSTNTPTVPGTVIAITEYGCT